VDRLRELRALGVDKLVTRHNERYPDSLPFDAVTEVQGNSIFVNVDKDEEELQARKQTVDTGRVSLGKEIVEEQRTMDVPVAREEVTIERHPVDRRPADSPIDASESDTIRVPVSTSRSTSSSTNSLSCTKR
jgi:uncharacterized protein (TIGR02271 family)